MERIQIVTAIATIPPNTSAPGDSAQKAYRRASQNPPPKLRVRNETASDTRRAGRVDASYAQRAHAGSDSMRNRKHSSQSGRLHSAQRAAALRVG